MPGLDHPSFHQSCGRCCGLIIPGIPRGRGAVREHPGTPETDVPKDSQRAHAISLQSAESSHVDVSRFSERVDCEIRHNVDQTTSRALKSITCHSNSESHQDQPLCHGAFSVALNAAAPLNIL
eukprot:418448-Prymnesium_polylepis.1